MRKINTNGVLIKIEEDYRVLILVRKVSFALVGVAVGGGAIEY